MKPKGITMRPRPAAGIAHMGRPRSPIALAEGGSVLDNILNVGGSALAGATGAAAADYANTGRPTPISAKTGVNNVNINPYAIPSISRTPTSNGGIAQAVTGYQAWPGMTAPTAQGQGVFGSFNATPTATYAPSASSFAPNGLTISGGNGPHSASAAGMSLPSDPGDMISQILQGVGLGKGYAKGGMVTDCYAAGGQLGTAPGGVQPQDARKRLFFAAVQALQGQSANPQAVLQAFVRAWGPQALEELKQHILSGQTPGHSPQQQPQQGLKGGGQVSGPGDGMSDQVSAVAGNQPIRLSTDEYVVPADAVAMLGNGSSRAGAAKLDKGIARLRHKKYGHSKQPPPLTPGENPILD